MNVALAALLLAACLQDPKKPPEHLVQGEIPKEAVGRGVQFLKSQVARLPQIDTRSISITSDSLVLWALLHGGQRESDEFKGLLKGLLERKLEATAEVSFQALVLEALDRVRYQPRIWQCAQFLVDNQAPDGSFSYGSPSIFVEDLDPAFKAVKDVPTPPDKLKSPPRKVAVLRKRQATGGDSWNSFLAVLGIRACHDAGILFEQDLISLSGNRWKTRVQGTPPQPLSWCCCDGAGQSCISASAGGIASLAVGNVISKRDPRKDLFVAGGLAWLGGGGWVEMARPACPEHRSGEPAVQKYAGLYAVACAALLAGAPKLGTHDWYPELAKEILAAQKPDGSWDGGNGNLVGGAGHYVNHPVWDTSFAVLFLARGMKPLAEGEGAKPKK